MNPVHPLNILAWRLLSVQLHSESQAKPQGAVLSLPSLEGSTCVHPWEEEGETDLDYSKLNFTC